MAKNTEEYIRYLENKIMELSKNNENNDNDDISFNNIIKYQEEFLFQKYAEKDYWITENKRLVDENAKLIRTIMLDSSYIDYLLNSYWWKITIPFRKISRKIKNKKYVNQRYIEEINPDTKMDLIEDKVSVIIFTNNPGNEITVQLDNIRKQKNIKNLEIIIVDRDSEDNIEELVKKYDIKFIQLGKYQLTDDEAYIKILPKISGDYIIIMDENKVIDSKYWMYQSIKPIIEKKATITVFFKDDISVVKNSTYFYDLKNRMVDIAGEQVLLLPENRDIIQYINPIILDKSSVIVKKKISNLFFI